MSQDHLNPDNCNKAMCKSCIFRIDGMNANIGEERMDEIRKYLADGTSSHICHITNKTCYGALKFQAEVFNIKGYIPHPTVESLLETANKILHGLAKV